MRLRVDSQKSAVPHQLKWDAARDLASSEELQHPGSADQEAVPRPSSEPVDVLNQLKTNIGRLEDLHGQLNFMMGEIQTVLRRMK